MFKRNPSKGGWIFLWDSLEMFRFYCVLSCISTRFDFSQGRRKVDVELNLALHVTREFSFGKYEEDELSKELIKETFGSGFIERLFFNVLIVKIVKDETWIEFHFGAHLFLRSKFIDPKSGKQLCEIYNTKQPVWLGTRLLSLDELKPIFCCCSIEVIAFFTGKRLSPMIDNWCRWFNSLSCQIWSFVQVPVLRKTGMTSTSVGCGMRMEFKKSVTISNQIIDYNFNESSIENDIQ